MFRKSINLARTITFIAIGITIVSQAKAILKRNAITRCFINIAVTDGNSDVIITEDVSCQNAKVLIHFRPFLISASVPSSYPDESDCPPSNVFYCCVKLTETSDTKARLINLGDGLKRYMISDTTDVFCKP